MQAQIRPNSPHRPLDPATHFQTQHRHRPQLQCHSTRRLCISRHPNDTHISTSRHRDAKRRNPQTQTHASVQEVMDSEFDQYNAGTRPTSHASRHLQLSLVHLPLRPPLRSRRPASTRFSPSWLALHRRAIPPTPTNRHRPCHPGSNRDKPPDPTLPESEPTSRRSTQLPHLPRSIPTDILPRPIP